MRTFFIWWVWFQKFIIRIWSTVWKQYRLDLTACIIPHAQSALPGKREQGRIEYKSLIILYESTMSHEAHWLILIDGHTLKTSWFIVDSCWIIILYVLPNFWQVIYITSKFIRGDRFNEKLLIMIWGGKI